MAMTLRLTTERTGVLSEPFVALPDEDRARAMRGLLELPAAIGPVIGQLRARHDLNILGMEALAAATRLEANVFLTAPSPRLEAALHAERKQVTVLP